MQHDAPDPHRVHRATRACAVRRDARERGPMISRFVSWWTDTQFVANEDYRWRTLWFALADRIYITVYLNKVSRAQFDAELAAEVAKYATLSQESHDADD